MSVEQGSTHRAVRGLTLGILNHAARAKEQRALEGMSETEENVKIDVVGRAEEFPIWAQVHIDFETVFIDAAGQLDTEFDTPHFTYGGAVYKGGPLALVACVTKWDINDRGECTGCILGISAISTDQGRKFQGELHARFLGYGMPADIYGGVTEQLDNE